MELISHSLKNLETHAKNLDNSEFMFHGLETSIDHVEAISIIDYIFTNRPTEFEVKWSRSFIFQKICGLVYTKS